MTIFRQSLRASTLATTLACTLWAHAATAQDAQLYEDTADPTASYVRVITAGDAVAVIDGQSFDSVASGVTPYVQVAAGDVSVMIGDIKGEGMVEPASYYTFLVGADAKSTMVRDEITNSPAQADLSLYNLSDLPSVDLFVPKAKAMALTGVPQSESRAVTLKAPLTLDFEVRSGETQLALLSAVELKRREGVTVIFVGSAGNYTAMVAENAISN